MRNTSSYEDYLEPIDKTIQLTSESRIQLSIAISLKRIADNLSPSVILTYIKSSKENP